MFPKIVLGVFLASTLIQIYYWGVLFMKITRWKTPDQIRQHHPVTTIISARNEAENIEKNLNRILNQNYHSHHVLIVNDNSTDTTLNVLLKMRKNDKTFTIVNAAKLSETDPGKKAALTQGIEAADTEVLLMTDADCYPLSNHWVEKMQNQFQNKTEIVLGFSPYERYKGWLNKLIRFDTVMIAIQYFSMALAGKPYMGVGRNMAYKKSLFRRIGGFAGHQHVASGDDDLFIQQAANAGNTGICLDEETFMVSEPKKTWKEYFTQKSRHLTTGSVYKLSHKFVLAMFLISLFTHLIGGIGLLTQLVFVQVVLVCMIIRLLIAWGIFGRIAAILKSDDLTKWFPILESSYLIFNIILTPTLLTFKPTKWK